MEKHVSQLEPGRVEAAADRLDSWKDIAAYLKRDVSTVQRWERREAMPVHRYLHDRLGSVYAFRSETRCVAPESATARPQRLPRCDLEE